MKTEKGWTVYMVECSDGTLYTGITVSVEKRVQAHNSKKGARCTRARLPVRLVYQESARTRSGALRREAEIKKWDRRKKLELMKEAA